MAIELDPAGAASRAMFIQCVPVARRTVRVVDPEETHYAFVDGVIGELRAENRLGAMVLSVIVVIAGGVEIQVSPEWLHECGNVTVLPFRRRRPAGTA